MDPSTVVIGIDPSSRKLAAIYSQVGHESMARHDIHRLPQDKPTACLMAFVWIRDLVTSLTEHTVYAAIELPVFGRGGPGSTIPQAQIGGALLAGAHMAGAEVIMVNNAHAKKIIIGKGNADKERIRQWVEDEWPDLYQQIEGDQDLCDAAMIYQAGVRAADIRERVASGEPIRRRAG